jgi:hypothetical protein
LGINVSREADFAPTIRLSCPRCLGLTGILNGIVAEQEMCRQMIDSGQAKNKLSYFGGVADFVAPV